MQNQGEFTTGDYEEIMNKASALSLVSNAILYWNTSRISNIVNELRKQGETEDDDTLVHISLLPYKHGVCLDMGKSVILDSVTHLLRDIVGIGSAPHLIPKYMFTGGNPLSISFFILLMEFP